MGMNIGCLNHNPYTLENYAKIERDCYHQYISDDIDTAEKGIINLIQTANEFKEAGFKGLDYKIIFSFSYVRLYFIYSHKGLPEKAESYLNQAKQIIIEKCDFTGNTLEQETLNVIDFLNQIDDRNEIAWKKNKRS